MAELSAWNLDGVWREKVSPDSAAYHSIYVDKPRVADPWSDEFDEGSPDLAQRGWLVYDSSASDTPPAQLAVRVGEVDPSLKPSTLQHGQYRSSLRNSKLLIQAHAISHWIFITKPVQRVASVYATRTACSRRDPGISDGLRFSTAPHNIATPPSPGSMYRGLSINAPENVFFHVQNSAGTVLQTNFPHAVGPVTCWLNVRQNDPNTLAFQTAFIERDFRHWSIDDWSVTATGTGPVYAGVLLRNADQLGSWAEVDYIRRYPANTFFPA